MTDEKMSGEELLDRINPFNLSKAELVENKRVAAEKVSKATMRIISHHPFYSTQLLRLKMIPNRLVPTMCVNSKKILYNPEFVVNCFNDTNEIITVLAHEVMHVLLGHSIRMGERDPRLWNIAGDHAINNILVDEGFKMPDHGTMDRKYRNMSSEDIYATLKQEQRQQGGGKGKPQKSQQQGSGGGQGSGQGDQQDQQQGQGDQQDDQRQPPRDANGQPRQPNEGEEPGEANGPSKEDWQRDMRELFEDYGNAGVMPEDADTNLMEAAQTIAQTLAAGKKAGTLPAALKGVLEQVLKGDVNWKEVLRDLMTRPSKDDFTMRRPNRRFLSHGLYLPSLFGEAAGEMVVAVDNSGSIDMDCYRRFVSEVSAIIEDLRPERVTVLYCDTRINKTVEYTPDEMPIGDAPIAGGGTSFVPPFEYVEQHGLNPEVLIYFTDLHGPFPGAPSYPVIWAVQPEPGYRDMMERVPFGTAISIGE